MEIRLVALTNTKSQESKKRCKIIFDDAIKMRGEIKGG